MVDVGFLVAVFALSILSGATASVVGFGIGSLLTPLFTVPLGATLAVAAVTLPHLFATALRCFRLRRDIDWHVLGRFGVLSAAGGLAGALVYSALGSAVLTGVLGGLLVLTAVANLSGLVGRRPSGSMLAGALGLVSGFFGGLAGNQGGLRSAALAAFPLTPPAFVATSTATGLLVDLARSPVYAAANAAALMVYWKPIALATAGVLIGTLVGERVLFGLSAAAFRRILAAAVGGLGVWLLARSIFGEG